MCCRNDSSGIKFSFNLEAADIPELTQNVKALTRASKEALQALTALREAQAEHSATAPSEAQEALNGTREHAHTATQS